MTIGLIQQTDIYRAGKRLQAISAPALVRAEVKRRPPHGGMQRGKEPINPRIFAAHSSTNEVRPDFGEAECLPCTRSWFDLGSILGGSPPLPRVLPAARTQKKDPMQAQGLLCVRTFHPNNKQLRVYMAQNSPKLVCPKPHSYC